MFSGGARTVGGALTSCGKLTDGLFPGIYGGGGLASGKGVAGGGADPALTVVGDVAAAIGTTTGAS